MTQPNLPATVADDLDTGLEDFSPEDVSTPRISIVHDAGMFKSNLTGEQFPRMYGILLGLVKQRIMWPSEVTDDGKPMCKSNDAAVGYPLMDGKSDQVFPWGDANLNKKDMPTDEHERVTIPCEACPFSQWTRGANGKNKPPRCSERYTFPIAYSTEGRGQPLLNAGITGFQRSGITPAKKYLSGFVQARLPLYSAYTEIGLDLQSRGTVKYSTPTFAKYGQVPQEEWDAHSANYRRTREFLRRMPRPGDDADDAAQQTASGNVPAAATASAFIPKQPSPTDVLDAVIVNTSFDDDDDSPLPF